ncbi:MAG: 4Fe-4S dicluster domain-containing protein [Magnetococcales bacterium]|nr:4Fe-4S dicluster domain-containing protein [Magnetococcales bacterium]
MSDNEALSYDVVVVGGGPAGLSAACRLAMSARNAGRSLSICVLEKGARIGGHQLSGALLHPRTLEPLFPDHVGSEASLFGGVSVDDESLLYLTSLRAISLPMVSDWQHRGHAVLSLGRLCRWLGVQAEALGVDLFPGFAAMEPLWDGARLAGVVTGAMGLDSHGAPQGDYQPGVVIHARAVVLAEGCRGSLTRKVVARLDLDRGRGPRLHALGLKELWEVPGGHPGRVLHTLGWPLDGSVHGGGFLYHFADGRVGLGLVAALDYRDPGFHPFRAFQRWKQHPAIAEVLEGGRPVAYGARALVEGAWQQWPRLVFDGGVLVGDAAGFLHPARLQGIDGAIHSGVMAADAVFSGLDAGVCSASALAGYPRALAASEMGRDLKAVRNVRPGFRLGCWLGLANAAWEGVSGGRSPWTWRMRQRDCQRLRPDSAGRGVADGSLDAPSGLQGGGERQAGQMRRMDALALSAIQHRPDQPPHVAYENPDLPLTEAGRRYGHPETRYCPAQVFECKVSSSAVTAMRLHPENCLHCKSCEIKDPLENIRWQPPEGGSGPDYWDM